MILKGKTGNIYYGWCNIYTKDEYTTVYQGLSCGGFLLGSIWYTQFYKGNKNKDIKLGL